MKYRHPRDVVSAMEIHEDRILRFESIRKIPQGYHAEEQPSIYLQRTPISLINDSHVSN